jgi:NAD(P)-dependent dehydrogenase (short-subunit alcohol dehydrogenase family)
MRINVTGAMLCCQIFGSVMPPGGSIINIASIYGLVAPDQRLYRRGFIKPAVYGASKGAIIALTKYLAAYWGGQSIRVNCLVPGGVFNGQDSAFVKRYAARVPLGRLAKPNEFNGIIIYLASNASSYSTGATFVIDGGWTAW